MPPPPPAVRRRCQGTRGPPPLPPPLPLRPESGRGSGPPTPPPHPPQLGSRRRRPPPPRSRGGAPPPRRDGDAVGGAAAALATASPHWRAGATRTTEQYGGRTPHDPSVTTAHSGRAEGGFRSARAPGGAVHGPPFNPPQPGAALRPRPHAHAGRERAGDTKGARIEYCRPPPRRGAGRPRRDTPPPRPPTGLQAAGAPAPTPRDRGDGPPPPARERSRSARRPPAPAAGSHGGREEQVSPRLCTRMPHRSYPEKPGEHEPEWYGGPHPPWTAQRQ